MKYNLPDRILHGGIDDLDAVVIPPDHRANVASRREFALAFFFLGGHSTFHPPKRRDTFNVVCSFAHCASAARGSVGLALIKIIFSSLFSVGGFS